MASIASLASIHVPKAHSGKTLIFLFSAIVFVITSTNGFTLIPLTKVVENVVCHQYYGQAQGLDTQIDEMLCKVPAVQSQMAYIFATMEVCTAITGFLAAFPWGIAADRYVIPSP